jgi:peptidoglycan DL-endopeptidase CwlO
MHRAKHRAAGAAAVPATTLIERFAGDPTSRPEPAGPRHGVATLPARDTDAPLGGPALFGTAPGTAPMLVVDTADERPRDAGALFGGTPEPDDLVPRMRAGDSPFGASRHAPRPRPPAVPAPRVPALPFGPLPTLRAQPVGAALSATVLGAAAAVTAVVAPSHTAVETTGSLAPVQSPAPAPVPPVGAVAVPAPALDALPDRPTVKVGELVTEVTSEMQKVEPAVTAPYTTVAQAQQLTSPAAVRKAALTNALGKLGKPYRWGAVGPNAFDCSGLVKWSFANAGKILPRTSRAMASVGVPVSRANLQPGDLVFFYTPISHVGIYIGNGQIVHASRTGQPVKVSNMSGMRFTTARRV